MSGRIHSVQSLGAVDGPGLRFVVFLQGCPLRCVYCHNPDTWAFNTPTCLLWTVEEAVETILRYRPYFGQFGGVTLSGGEPLLQSSFAAALFKNLRELGIHTALDTSGIGNLKDSESVLLHTDLVLCDLKFATEDEYQRYCQGKREEVLRFLSLTEKMEVPLWIRHVVVPGLNDDDESIRAIAKDAREFSNLQKIELLPFRKLCLSKYESMNLPFPLADHSECSDSLILEKYHLLL